MSQKTYKVEVYLDAIYYQISNGLEKLGITFFVEDLQIFRGTDRVAAIITTGVGKRVQKLELIVTDAAQLDAVKSLLDGHDIKNLLHLYCVTEIELHS